MIPISAIIVIVTLRITLSLPQALATAHRAQMYTGICKSLSEKIMAKQTFKNLMLTPPHNDITAINKFIVSSCFARDICDVMSYIGKMGYACNYNEVSEHVKLIEKQFHAVKHEQGCGCEIDVFCNVAGTALFNEFMSVCGKKTFYLDAMKFEPDFFSGGPVKHIRKTAIIALLRNETKILPESVTMIMGAIEAALKKIGVDPQEEVNSTTKIFIATKAFLEVVGGIQFYLPKADSLSRIMKKASIYADSYVMSPAELAIKYGESGKSIYTTIKHVGAVIGNYEQS